MVSMYIMLDVAMYGIIFVVALVLGLLLNAVFLLLAMKFVGGCVNTEFSTVFVTAILMVVVSIIPLLGCILQWYVIQSRHTEGDWGKAIVVWLIAGLLPMIIILAVLFIVFPSLFLFLTPQPTPTYP